MAAHQVEGSLHENAQDLGVGIQPCLRGWLQQLLLLPLLRVVVVVVLLLLLLLWWCGQPGRRHRRRPRQHAARHAGERLLGFSRGTRVPAAAKTVVRVGGHRRARRVGAASGRGKLPSPIHAGIHDASKCSTRSQALNEGALAQA